ncbi:hypothetical protein BaRGS_00006153 [Batillaria attramentaria]|uniref:Uncharacterized protein n=1 Tax=Batillaria attramentaria TaxID=370345 RepID=A0ABD0LTX6_9CAEN
MSLGRPTAYSPRLSLASPHPYHMIDKESSWALMFTADLLYRDDCVTHEDNWKSSVKCNLAAFLWLFSSVVLTLTLRYNP